MQKVIHDMRADFGNLSKDVSEHKQKQVDKITEELRAAAKVTKNILEDKIEPALTLPSILAKKSENHKIKSEMTRDGLTQAKQQFEAEFKDLQKLHDQRIEYLKQQFDDMCIKKRDDLDKHAVQFERYLNVKK